MKAIMTRIQKFSRPGVILMATVVAIITSIVVANATQTITAPNAAFISYNLAGNTNSAAITPAANRSVLVMGCCTTAGGHRGVGQVSLLHIPSTSITWVGLSSASGSVTSGTSTGALTNIVSIDGGGLVSIEVATADTIFISNGGPDSVAGNVTLVW